jgi:hypothetical protein
MTKRFRHVGREEFEGEGDLVEGETLLGRVRYEFVVTTKPSGLRSVRGSAQPAPGSRVNLRDVIIRNAPVTLSFEGGSWDCWLASVSGPPSDEHATLVNRAGLHLEDDSE